MKTCRVVELGRIPYGQAFALQQRLAAARKAGACPDVLLLCEHPHVITLGRNGKREHLRAPEELLGQMGVELHHTDRGGDVTYHGPGQIVGYPIVDLAEIRRDVGWYVRQLEQAMIEAGWAFGVEAFRVAGRTGVWVCPADHRAISDPSGKGTAPGEKSPEEPKNEEKLGAIGVHLSRWVTSHGFAYNVATDLRYFDLIVPCGIADRGATSLEKLLGRKIPLREVQGKIVDALGAALTLEMVASELGEMTNWITSEVPSDPMRADTTNPAPATEEIAAGAAEETSPATENR